MKDPDWESLTKRGFLDPHGESWRIQYEPRYVIPAPVEDMVTLKLLLTTDSAGDDIMGAGAIFRKADLTDPGRVEVMILQAICKTFDTQRFSVFARSFLDHKPKG